MTSRLAGKDLSVPSVKELVAMSNASLTAVINGDVIEVSNIMGASVTYLRFF